MRYAEHSREAVDDGWFPQDEPPVRTRVGVDASRSAISYNQSPDVPFDRSVNPYRGCEHGCIYCYARPTHAWLGLSPGLDFETRLFQKPDVAEQLREELARPGYRPAPLALGANTDPYQPIERSLRLTRGLLEVLEEARHPLIITTKSAMVCRDLDLLSSMAERRLVAVQLSITTLDAELARRLEPRATRPGKRLEAVARLSAAGVPVGVLVSPLIPGLTDCDLERILERAKDAGATVAGSLLLRLPLEVAPLFLEWLAEHYPERAAKVESLIRQCRAGELNDAAFGRRFEGSGPVARMLAQRVAIACKRLGLLDRESGFDLDLSRFRPPGLGGQLSLFDD